MKVQMSREKEKVTSSLFHACAAIARVLPIIVLLSRH